MVQYIRKADLHDAPEKAPPHWPASASWAQSADDGIRTALSVPAPGATSGVGGRIPRQVWEGRTAVGALAARARALRNSRKPKGAEMKQPPSIKPRGGRPSRAEASAKALAALEAAGIDPMTVDPRLILRSIAADPSAPA